MAYPKFLPVPTRTNYAKKPSYAPAPVKMDDGTTRQRKIPGAIPYTYTLTWNLSYSHASFFQAWLEYDVNPGNMNLSVPLAGQTVEVKPKTGVASYQPNGNKWLVSLEVEEIRQGAALPVRGGALPVWPVSLPSFEKSGFTLSAPDAMAYSDIESGLRETRVRFAERIYAYSGTMVMDLAQRNAFWDFWHSTLLGGTRRFMAPFASPVSQSLVKAKFSAIPEESANGGWFNLNIQLETSDAPMLSYEGYREFFYFINTYVVSGYVEDGYAGYWSLD